MSLYDDLKSQPLPSREFNKLLSARAYASRSLTDVLFELTPVCNFRCPFCYARLSPAELAERKLGLMELSRWKAAIDELCELGVWQLSLTGGECTLYPGFVELYEYAYNKGLGVTVMTNGSAISEELLSLFRRMPPSRIYITIYGNSPESYLATCGAAEFYDRVHRNIEALVADRQQVVAQFTAGESNIDDLEGVYTYSKSLGIPMRYSGELIQSGRCTAETIEREKADPDKWLQEYQKVYLDRIGQTAEEYEKATAQVEHRPVFDEHPIEKGVTCSAGRSSMCVRWDGTVRPCVTWDAFSMPIEGHTLRECWEAMVHWADEVPRLKECQNCLHKTLCPSCMAAHYNDTHELGKPSPRLCYKCTHPERAAETEAFYREHGYLRDKDMQL